MTAPRYDEIFLVIILDKRIFLMEFSAKISAAKPQMKFQKLNIFGIFFQIFSFFFFQIGPEHGHESQKNEKNF